MNLTGARSIEIISIYIHGRPVTVVGKWDIKELILNFVAVVFLDKQRDKLTLQFYYLALDT